jgi:hypothetical protein
MRALVLAPTIFARRIAVLAVVASFPLYLFVAHLHDGHYIVRRLVLMVLIVAACAFLLFVVAIGLFHKLRKRTALVGAITSAFLFTAYWPAMLALQGGATELRWRNGLAATGFMIVASWMLFGWLAVIGGWYAGKAAGRVLDSGASNSTPTSAA